MGTQMWLSNQEQELAVSIALKHHSDRDLLLSELPAPIVSRLNHKSTPFDQLTSDVNTLNGMSHIPGLNELPIWLWLRKLRTQVGPFVERDDVDRLMVIVKQREAKGEPSDEPPSSPAVEHAGAVTLWRKKLSRLLEAEALEDDVTRKFKLAHQIQEARAKIAELTRC